jgi:hypothetical protein
MAGACDAYLSADKILTALPMLSVSVTSNVLFPFGRHDVQINQIACICVRYTFGDCLQVPHFRVQVLSQCARQVVLPILLSGLCELVQICRDFFIDSK